jgi:hypothetical protein
MGPSSRTDSGVGRKTIFLAASAEKHAENTWTVRLRDCHLD